MPRAPTGLNVSSQVSSPDLLETVNSANIEHKFDMLHI